MAREREARVGGGGSRFGPCLRGGRPGELPRDLGIPHKDKGPAPTSRSHRGGEQRPWRPWFCGPLWSQQNVAVAGLTPASARLGIPAWPASFHRGEGAPLSTPGQPQPRGGEPSWRQTGRGVRLPPRRTFPPTSQRGPWLPCAELGSPEDRGEPLLQVFPLQGGKARRAVQTKSGSSPARPREQARPWAGRPVWRRRCWPSGVGGPGHPWAAGSAASRGPCCGPRPPPPLGPAKHRLW